jgi:hypothetical protein
VEGGAPGGWTCPLGHAGGDTRFCRVCGLPMGPATPGPAPRPNRWLPTLVAGLVAAGLGIAVTVVVLNRSSTKTISTHSTTTTSSTTTSATTTPPPTTTQTTTTPTTQPITPTTLVPTAELQTGWTLDPNKCGPVAGDRSQPFSPSRVYQVTATIHVWSAPTTSSNALGTITSTIYGPGGIGCPSPSDPTVAVACKVQGQTIVGPFGSDSVWEQVSWKGQNGYVPDEWVNTQWDVDSLPVC